MAPGLSVWNWQIPAGTATNKIKPKAAYVIFSNFNFSDNIPPLFVKLALQQHFKVICLIFYIFKQTKNTLKHKKYYIWTHILF